MNTALLLAVYGIIPIFCAYMVYKTGKETSDRLDRIYERYNKMDDKIIDFLEERNKSDRN